MKITINKMIIRNFKGIKHYEFNPNGESVQVFGENGTGKTTLYDAFLWCLFGKNSADQSDTKFDWKPLNAENQEIHHLETEVIVSLEIDGTIKEFGRNITEKWTKKRGAIIESFDGHTTVYSIDGLNVKQKEYKEMIASYIDEDVFKMLTKLNYFPEVMDWKQRRQVLIDMVGDLTDEEVIASNKNLKEVPNILDGKTVDERLALTKQQMKQINKDISSLPGRIDEVDRSLPDLTELNKGDLNKEKLALQADLERKQTELSEIKNGFNNAKISSEIRALEVHKQELKLDYDREQEKGLDELKEKLIEAKELLFEARSTNSEIHRKKIGYEKDIAGNQQAIERLEKENESNRNRFSAIRTEEYPKFDESKLICPTCQRPIEEHQANELHEQHDKLTSEFNSNKAKRLEQIREAGIKNNEIIQEMKQENEDIQSDIDRLEIDASDQKVIDLQNTVNELEQMIQQAKQSINPFNDTEEALEIDMKINALNNKLTNEIESNKTLQNEITDQINKIQVAINQVNDGLYQFDLHSKQSERREELIQEEQRLSLEYGQLEQHKFILEEFIKAKVDLLTDSINALFEVVSFKLFNTNINGGIEECCEPTVNGVNYSTGLNNAARINAGLDIISTLMKHNDMYVPVFVDNAEGVNNLLEVDTQIITLSVSKDKKLTVNNLNYQKK